MLPAGVVDSSASRVSSLDDFLIFFGRSVFWKLSNTPTPVLQKRGWMWLRTKDWRCQMPKKEPVSC
jgi:hypothetical protein